MPCYQREENGQVSVLVHSTCRAYVYIYIHSSVDTDICIRLSLPARLECLSVYLSVCRRSIYLSVYRLRACILFLLALTCIYPTDCVRRSPPVCRDVFVQASLLFLLSELQSLGFSFFLFFLFRDAGPGGSSLFAGSPSTIL